jgi:hypothetical protein
MYWLRTFNPVDILLTALLTLGWAAGGWLLATHAFRVRSSERLITGFVTGWLLYVTLAVGLANVVHIPAAFWLAGIFVLAGGILAAVRGKGRKVPWGDFAHWRQIVWLAGLTLMMVFIQRGLAIFDDFVHLPLVSVMAAGDLPPHFFLNPQVAFGYHLGLQAWAASLVRLAGMTPWSGWDLAKALSISLTLMVGWLWARRWTRDDIGAIAGSLLFTYGGGAVWLLLFLPGAAITWMSSHVPTVLTGAATAPDLPSYLTATWAIEGADPLKFPAVMESGIFGPVGFRYGLSAAFPYMTLLALLLLVSGRRLGKMSVLVLGLIFASLALSAEFMFPFLVLAVVLALAVSLLRARKDGIARPFSPGGLPIWGWIAALFIGGVLSLAQGGAITVRFQDILSALQGIQQQSTYTDSFSLRWPPALFSSFFGSLQFTDPAQLLVMFCELGTGVLLGPTVILKSWRWLKAGRWLQAALGVTSLALLLVPIFLKYGVDVSIVRMPMTAIWLWLVLGWPAVVYWYRRGRQNLRMAIGLGYTVAVLGGLVTFAIQLPAMQVGTYSYFIQTSDAEMTRLEWDRLEPGAQVLSQNPTRVVTVFGRATTANSSIYVSLPAVDALLDELDPAHIARAGYSYIYMDEGWWKGLSPAKQAALQQPCVKQAAKTEFNTETRQLLDIRSCH